MTSLFLIIFYLILVIKTYPFSTSLGLPDPKLIKPGMDIQQAFDIMGIDAPDEL